MSSVWSFIQSLLADQSLLLDFMSVALVLFSTWNHLYFYFALTLLGVWTSSLFLFDLCYHSSSHGSDLCSLSVLSWKIFIDLFWKVSWVMVWFKSYAAVPFNIFPLLMWNNKKIPKLKFFHVLTDLKCWLFSSADKWLSVQIALAWQLEIIFPPLHFLQGLEAAGFIWHVV